MKFYFLLFVFILSSSAFAQTPFLFINEFMADNNYSHADEEGQYDDWIEVYNGGSESVYLGDKYLSDDHSTPTKWPMPDVTMEPGEYLVFWCDEDQGQGENHTNFKLNKTGEQLGIWNNDTNNNTPIDTFTYGNIDPDVPWGLYPNGQGEIMKLSWRTPGASNVPLAVENPKESQVDVFPNPVIDLLSIQSKFPIIWVEIISVEGKSWKLEARGKRNMEIDFSDFAAGIYTLRVKSEIQVDQLKVLKL